ncbi:MAG: bis(5'-nucleosyl)-tetraphosphatase (symmetrical) YqeK [Eubacteriales bacterium]|nr:bis(5'-nucleosyl)-tetraphosphatase (symmetrical) YqeK [Eubacteriales bacterium]
MYNTDEYIELIKGRLSPYRFNHSMCVADRAVELAKRNNLDSQKAYVAGILHDIMKEESLDSQQKIIESTGFTMTAVELASPNVYHQMSGAVYVRDILGIDDEDIVGGIRYHTTGRADMTPFEMLIYLADFTSADRDYPDVDIMRKKTDTDFFDGMLYSLTYTITKLAQQSKQIHPDTLHCYNWVLGIKNMKQKGNVK